MDQQPPADITLSKDDVVKLVQEKYPGRNVIIDLDDSTQTEFGCLLAFMLGLEATAAATDHELTDEERQRALQQLRDVASGETVFLLPIDAADAWKGESTGGALWRGGQKKAAAYAVAALKRVEEWDHGRDEPK